MELEYKYKKGEGWALVPKADFEFVYKGAMYYLTLKKPEIGERFWYLLKGYSSCNEDGTIDYGAFVRSLTTGFTAGMGHFNTALMEEDADRNFYRLDDDRFVHVVLASDG